MSRSQNSGTSIACGGAGAEQNRRGTLDSQRCEAGEGTLSFPTCHRPPAQPPLLPLLTHSPCTRCSSWGAGSGATRPPQSAPPTAASRSRRPPAAAPPECDGGMRTRTRGLPPGQPTRELEPNEVHLHGNIDTPRLPTHPHTHGNPGTNGIPGTPTPTLKRCGAMT